MALIVRCLCFYAVWLARLARNCHTLILGKDRDFLISCCFLLFLLDPIFDRPFAAWIYDCDDFMTIPLDPSKVLRLVLYVSEWPLWLYSTTFKSNQGPSASLVSYYLFFGYPTRIQPALTRFLSIFPPPSGRTRAFKLRPEHPSRALSSVPVPWLALPVNSSATLPAKQQLPTSWVRLTLLSGNTALFPWLMPI